MRIEWNVLGGSTITDWSEVRETEHLYGHIGWLKGQSKANKYYIGPRGRQGTYIADVAESPTVWHNINMSFATREEALQWCQMVEDTGAY